jgi:hypothetical protein
MTTAPSTWPRAPTGFRTFPTSWAATTPTLLIKEGYVTVPGGNPGRTYDISPDGQRFLLIKAGGGAEQAAVPITLIVVQHFDEELKRLVPTN